MLRDNNGNGGGRPSTPRNVLGEWLEVCSISIGRGLSQTITLTPMTDTQLTMHYESLFSDCNICYR